MSLRMFLLCFGLYLLILKSNSSPISKDIVGDLPPHFIPSNTTITDDALKRAIQFVQLFMDSSYTIPNKNVTYIQASKDVFIQVNVTNGLVTNPSQFRVDKSQVNMSTLEFQVHLTFPIINITGDYFLNASTDVFKAFGNGPFRLNSTGIEIEVDISLGQFQNKTLYLKNITADYNVSSTNARFDGLLNDTQACDLMNDAINEFIPYALHDFKSDIDKEISIIGQKYTAYMFNNATVEQLIQFINGLAII